MSGRGGDPVVCFSDFLAERSRLFLGKEATLKVGEDTDDDEGVIFAGVNAAAAAADEYEGLGSCSMSINQGSDRLILDGFGSELHTSLGHAFGCRSL